jgi:hypothetical protein
MRRRTDGDVMLNTPGVMEFWTNVLGRCRERYWLEDWRGVNIWARDLKRASLCLQ